MVKTKVTSQVAAEEHEAFSRVAGERLSRERERQRQTLEEASAALHIRAAQLQALEEGDFSVFKAEVYARGAYVLYAEWLGLDERESQQAVSRALAEGRVLTPLKMHTPATLGERILSPRSVIIAGSTFLALVVGGYIAWQLQSFWQLPALTLSSPEHTYISDSAITVRGRAEPDIQVRINNEPVLLQEDASFETSLYLRPGINVIRVEAENAAGRVHIIEKHVLQPRYKS